MYLSEKVVVPVLREEYDKWIEILTTEEKHAIRKYSYNSFDSRPNRFFKRLNAMLRGEYNKSDVKMLKKYAKIMSIMKQKNFLLLSSNIYRDSTGENENLHISHSSIHFKT